MKLTSEEFIKRFKETLNYADESYIIDLWNDLMDFEFGENKLYDNDRNGVSEVCAGMDDYDIVRNASSGSYDECDDYVFLDGDTITSCSSLSDFSLYSEDEITEKAWDAYDSDAIDDWTDYGDEFEWANYEEDEEEEDDEDLDEKVVLRIPLNDREAVAYYFGNMRYDAEILPISNQLQVITTMGDVRLNDQKYLTNQKTTTYSL